VAKLFVLTRNECVASPCPTYKLGIITSYVHATYDAILLPTEYRRLSDSLSVCQSVTLVSHAKRLKRSSYRLGLGLGCPTVQIPHGKGQFWRVNGRTIRTLCGHLCKHGWTDRGAVWDVGSHGPKASRVRWGYGSLWKGQFWWIGVPIAKYRHFLP